MNQVAVVIGGGLLRGGAAAGKDHHASHARHEARELEEVAARDSVRYVHVRGGLHGGSFPFCGNPLPRDATGGDPFPSPLQLNARKLRTQCGSIALWSTGCHQQAGKTA